MAAAAPSQVEIGTTGTVASLVSQEIEYFKRLELGRKDVASTRSASKPKPKPGSILPITPKRKKKEVINGRRSSSSNFLPSICSVVEITETGYRNLRTEADKLPREG